MHFLFHLLSYYQNLIYYLILTILNGHDHDPFYKMLQIIRELLVVSEQDLLLKIGLQKRNWKLQEQADLI